MQRVHDARDEPSTRAVEDEAHHPQGNRANGPDHPQEVLVDSNATQAEYLRGCYDSALQVP